MGVDERDVAQAPGRPCGGSTRGTNRDNRLLGARRAQRPQQAVGPNSFGVTACADNGRPFTASPSMPDLTTFAALLAARTFAPGSASVTFVIPEDWQQGRTTFGGLIATLAVQAMRDVAGGAWDAGVALRALQVSFIGPVDKGPVRVDVQVLREGKSVRQVQALVVQGGQTAALLLGVFGAARETTVPVMAPEQPAVAKGPDDSMQ